MKKILVAAVALIALAIAGWLLIKPTARVATVTSGRAVQAVPGSVVVRAEFYMELKSEIGGRVLSSQLELGKHFAAGDILLQIDSGDLQLDIDRIQGEYEAAKQRQAVGSSVQLDLDTASENLAVLEKMAEMGSYPLAELEKRRRAVKQIEQRVALEAVANKREIANFENTLAVKQRQLQKMTIRAPFDGVVSAINARVGDLISVGSSIATLISTSRTVEARISEENFADLRTGQKASVRFLGYGGTLYPATVTQILPTSDPDTQRYIIYLNVKIAPGKLVPGITGEVSIVVGERSAKAIIPRRALFGNNVYVVEEGRVRLRHVETGYVSVTVVEILKGLKAGEQVIVEKVDEFRDGDRVRAEVTEIR
jgi:RND family efflux transporter MFP subunit